MIKIERNIEPNGFFDKIKRSESAFNRMRNYFNRESIKLRILIMTTTICVVYLFACALIYGEWIFLTVPNQLGASLLGYNIRIEGNLCIMILKDVFIPLVSYFAVFF